MQACCCASRGTQKKKKEGGGGNQCVACYCGLIATHHLHLASTSAAIAFSLNPNPVDRMQCAMTSSMEWCDDVISADTGNAGFQREEFIFRQLDRWTGVHIAPQ